MACQQTKVRIAWRLVRRTRASAAPQMGWGWTAGKLSGEFDRGAGEAAIARHELRVTNCASRLALEMKWWRARQESNLYQELRKLSFYPLNYGRSAREAVLYPSLSSVHEIDQIPAQTARNPARSIGRASMTPLYNPAFACWAIRCSPPECAVLIFLCCRHQAPGTRLQDLVMSNQQEHIEEHSSPSRPQATDRHGHTGVRGADRDHHPTGEHGRLRHQGRRRLRTP